MALQVKCLPGVREGAPGLSKEGPCPVSSPGHLNDSVPPEEVLSPSSLIGVALHFFLSDVLLFCFVAGSDFVIFLHVSP